MFLNRIGNKTRIADKIYSHFPPHKTYLEPFFGCGGMLFNKKPIAKYNIVNDNNKEVFTCFMVAMTKPKELLRAIQVMPFHKDLLDYFKTTKMTDDIMIALKVIFLSNFTFMGQGETLRFDNVNYKLNLIKKLKSFIASDFIQNIQLHNCDFRKFFTDVSFKNENAKNNAFAYSDPPYLNTENNYGENFKKIKWTKQDFLDLIQVHIESGLRFAISEFDDPFIIETAKQNNLNIITIGERLNLGNRRTEILITNYESKNLNNYLL